MENVKDLYHKELLKKAKEGKLTGLDVYHAMLFGIPITQANVPNCRAVYSFAPRNSSFIESSKVTGETDLLFYDISNRVFKVYEKEEKHKIKINDEEHKITIEQFNQIREIVLGRLYEND